MNRFAAICLFVAVIGLSLGQLAHLLKHWLNQRKETP